MGAFTYLNFQYSQTSRGLALRIMLNTAFSLYFSSSSESFVIRVSLLHSWFSILVSYKFQVSFNLKVACGGQNNSKYIYLVTELLSVYEQT